MSTLEKHPVDEETVADAGMASGIGRVAQPAGPTMVNPLMLDFLTWLDRGPRSYADAMEAWRTSCPRFTIWEDAIEDGLCRLKRGRGATLSGAAVVLTPRGTAVLQGAKKAPRPR
ncbi:MAG: hypothetical protein M3509_10115 [Chloroflexota bacterium]|nr:hypothetical protein [Chloroflexota bacterium]